MVHSNDMVVPPWLCAERDVDLTMLGYWRAMIGYRNAQPGGSYYRMTSKEQAIDVQKLLGEVPKWVGDFFTEPFITRSGDEKQHKYYWLSQGAISWLGCFHKKQVVPHKGDSNHQLSSLENCILTVAVEKGMSRWDYLSGFKGYVGEVAFTYNVGSVVIASLHYRKGHNWYSSTSLLSVGEKHIALKGLGLVPTFHDYAMSLSPQYVANEGLAHYGSGQITWPERPSDPGMALMYDALRKGVSDITSRVRESQASMLRRLLSEKVSQKIGNPNYQAGLSDYADAYRWFNQIVLFMILNAGFEKPVEGVATVLSKKLSYECDKNNIQFYPAGMTAIAHFLQRHLMTTGKRIACTGQSYYEAMKALGLVGKQYKHKLFRIEDNQEGFWDVDVAMLELLPSNAGSQHHGVLNLYNAIKLWMQNKQSFTCMIDVTFGGYEHPELRMIIDRFAKEIQDGRLHLYIVSSLAKSYPTLGSDIASGGLCVYLGKGCLPKLNWMQSPAHRLLDRYFAYMIDLNHGEIANSFFDLTVERAGYLRGLLSKSSVLTVTKVSDPVPYCTVSILGFKGGHNPLVERLSYSLTRAIPVIPSRSSLGFPETTVTDIVGAGVRDNNNVQHPPDAGLRLSVGLESPDALKEIARQFNYFAHVFASLQLLLAVSSTDYSSISEKDVDNYAYRIIRGLSSDRRVSDREIRYTLDGSEKKGWLALENGPNITVSGHEISLEKYQYDALMVMIRAGLIDWVEFEFLSCGDYWTWPYSTQIGYLDEHFHIVQKSNHAAISYTYGKAESLKVSFLGTVYNHNQVLVWCREYLDWKALSTLQGIRLAKILELLKRQEFSIVVAGSNVRLQPSCNIRPNYYRAAESMFVDHRGIKPKLDYFEAHPDCYEGLDVISESGPKKSMRRLFLGFIEEHVMKCLDVKDLVDVYGRVKIMYEDKLTKSHNIGRLLLWARCVAMNSPDLVAVKRWYNKGVKSSDIEKTLGYAKRAMGILNKPDVVKDLERMAECMTSW